MFLRFKNLKKVDSALYTYTVYSRVQTEDFLAFFNLKMYLSTANLGQKYKTNFSL